VSVARVDVRRINKNNDCVQLWDRTKRETHRIEPFGDFETPQLPEKQDSEPVSMDEGTQIGTDDEQSENTDSPKILIGGKRRGGSRASKKPAGKEGRQSKSRDPLHEAA
jgi:glutaredoxin